MPKVGKLYVASPFLDEGPFILIKIEHIQKNYGVEIDYHCLTVKALQLVIFSLDTPSPEDEKYFIPL
jgi:hypothetical protein